MDYKPPKHTVRTGPEAKGAKRLRIYMEARDWWFKKLSGSIYQSGMPDLLALHMIHGLRWIETKVEGGYLRDSQVHICATFAKYGQQVYVLRDERDYPLLFRVDEFGKPKDNWKQYVHVPRR